jgi:hypothetical protein
MLRPGGIRIKFAPEIETVHKAIVLGWAVGTVFGVLRL